MIVNGTTYKDETPKEVIDILEHSRETHKRLRFFFGDTKTGKAWAEEWMVMGHVGRSTGTSKIPLLIHNERSMGGPGLLDGSIVAILGGQTWLYRHPKFDTGHFEAKKTRSKEYPYSVFHDGALQARFKTGSKAQHYCDFMMGLRLSK